MKKKILFVIPEYTQGGVPKVLENLIPLLDKDKFDISIYCLYEDGGSYYKEKFKSLVLPKSYLYYLTHDNKFTRKIFGLWHKINKKANFNWLYKREAKYIEKKYKFDTAISFQEGTATDFVSYIPNVKRIGWIHCDYPNSLGKERYNIDKITYSCYDMIVCVSKTVASSMALFHPEFARKIQYIHNVMNTQYILEQSMKKSNEFPISNDDFSIISVGRFVAVKQFEKIPDIAHQIQERTNKPFRWYIIASGDACRKATEDMIKYYHLEKVVIILGAKDNPYKYICKSNLLVCTSYSESYPTVINEAKILHIPVISTDYPSAHEVIDESYGIICPLQEMPIIISEIINNTDKYNDLKRNVSLFNYENGKLIKEIEDIII